MIGWLFAVNASPRASFLRGQAVAFAIVGAVGASGAEWEWAASGVVTAVMMYLFSIGE